MKINFARPQCIILLVRSFIDPTFCGIFVCRPLQFSIIIQYFAAYVTYRPEYPTERLDKIPALQAEFELAEKKKHWLISWLGNVNERLAS